MFMRLIWLDTLLREPLLIWMLTVRIEFTRLFAVVERNFLTLHHLLMMLCWSLWLCIHWLLMLPSFVVIAVITSLRLVVLWVLLLLIPAAIVMTHCLIRHTVVLNISWVSMAYFLMLVLVLVKVLHEIVHYIRIRKLGLLLITLLLCHLLAIDWSYVILGATYSQAVILVGILVFICALINSCLILTLAPFLSNVERFLFLWLALTVIHYWFPFSNLWVTLFRSALCPCLRRVWLKLFVPLEATASSMWCVLLLIHAATIISFQMNAKTFSLTSYTALTGIAALFVLIHVILSS